NVVASMPPIINSQITGKITEKTKNLFIEVTGFNWKVVETALEVICMALADRGGKIFSCKINFPSTKKPYLGKNFVITPSFEIEKIVFEKNLIAKKTGLKLKDSQIKSLLEKARYNVKINGNKIIAEYPSYRTDILHSVDVIEDLLISFGYNNIAPEKIDMNVIGSHKKEVLFADFVRDGAIGLGLQEILTFNLTSKEIQSDKMLLEERADFVTIKNPVSLNYEIMRKKLSPQLLSFISKNKNQLFPQKIFEIGTCLSLDSKEENGVKQSTNICVISTHTNVNFTEIKSILVSLCDYLGLELKIKKKFFPFFGENSAEIIVNGKKGFIGEINKKVEQNFGLKKPITLFEFEL
ncbi:MAG: phenylalanine--tRNA ligase subunit beta, partial [Candidatus ainarchaeum sp.]|nr:phenylalanine--tRNA ligase subunit beta [Candidatus ainarchaeum sp.]